MIIKHIKHIFKEGYWSKQFILLQTSYTILTVQIITIIFIESKRFEHVKSRSLPADSEFLTLWCWMVYFWTTQNSTLVHVCGAQRSRNKCSLHVPRCTKVCSHFLLLLMVEKIHELITMISWWHVQRGNHEWWPTLRSIVQNCSA